MRQLKILAICLIVFVLSACASAELSDVDGIAGGGGYENLDLAFPLDPNNLPDWESYIPNDLLEASVPNPVDVTVILNEENTRSKEIGVLGGTLTLSAPNGVIFTLEIPAQALLGDELIGMTLVDSIEGVAADGAVLAAVNLEPSGLALLRPAKLVIELPGSENLDDYEGFSTTGLGEDFHNIMALNISSRLELALSHFSTPGVISFTANPVDSSDAVSLKALERASGSISEHLGYQTNDNIARAEEEYGPGSPEYTDILVENKRRAFWEEGNGLVYELDHAANNPDSVEVAVVNYMNWKHVGSIFLRDYFLTLDIDYPFEREESIAELLIAMALQNGLNGQCVEPVDALRKIRFLHLTQTLPIDPYNIGLFKVLDEFSIDFARENAKACARFKFRFASYIDGMANNERIVQFADADEIFLQFTVEPEAMTLHVVQDAPSLETGGDCDMTIFDGEIEALNLTWPANIFFSREGEQERPPSVVMRITRIPTMGCRGTGGFIGVVWWAVYQWYHGLTFEFELPAGEHSVQTDVNIEIETGTLTGVEETTITWEHSPE